MAAIELSDFVKNTLVQIGLGVSDANKEMHKQERSEYPTSPYQLHRNQGDSKAPGISFDIAVTASSGSSDKAGANISVVQVFKIGGSTEASEADSHVHRIRFEVGLSMDSN